MQCMLGSLGLYTVCAGFTGVIQRVLGFLGLYRGSHGRWDHIVCAGNYEVTNGVPVSLGLCSVRWGLWGLAVCSGVTGVLQRMLGRRGYAACARIVGVTQFVPG